MRDPHRPPEPGERNPQAAPTPRARFGDWPLLLLSALATTMALVGIGRDVWLDEATTYLRASLPLDQLVEESIRKRHIPTYFLLMHGFLSLGDSELMLRLPSALAGIATVALMYFVGRSVGGVRVGFFAGLWLVMSPLQVRYWQETRMYALSTFAAACALSAVCYVARDPARAAAPLSSPAHRGTRLLAWVGLVPATVAVLYLHNTGLFFAAALGIVAALQVLLARGARRPLALRWAAVLLLCALCYLPWVSVLVSQVQGLGDRVWGAPTPARVRMIFGQLYLLHPSAPWLWVPVAAVLVAGMRALRARVVLLSSLLALWLGGAGIILAVSVLVRPMFGPRLMLWTALPLALLAGLGLDALWRAPLFERLPRPIRSGAPLIVIALGFLAVGLANRGDYHIDPWIPWRDVASRLRDAHVEQGAAIVVVGLPARPLRYYFERRHGGGDKVRISVTPRRPHDLPRRMDRAIDDQALVYLVARVDKDGFFAQPAIDWLERRGERFHYEAHERARIYGYRLRSRAPRHSSAK